MKPPKTPLPEAAREEMPPRIKVDDAVLCGSDSGYWERTDKIDLLTDGEDPIYVPLQELEASQRETETLRAQLEAMRKSAEMIRREMVKEIIADLRGKATWSVGYNTFRYLEEKARAQAPKDGGGT